MDMRNGEKKVANILKNGQFWYPWSMVWMRSFSSSRVFGAHLDPIPPKGSFVHRS